MSGIGPVRASREGDQFHYLWAARQCLLLLPGQSDLVAVTIEGPSTEEAPEAPVEDGEEIIDAGLYFGAESVQEASAIQYVQLKHSTLQTDVPWTASGLAKTIAGFAGRYAKMVAATSAQHVADRFRFSFVTNRPISASLALVLAELANGTAPGDMALGEQIFGYTGISRADALEFFRLFAVESAIDGLWAQRNLLAEDLKAYLPDADWDAPVQLKELVTQKALSTAAKDPAIRRHDVLRALKVDEADLLPAPNLVKGGLEAFPREQEDDIRRQIRESSTPILIHADGGVGKSILAARLAATMPAGSLAIHYDCFGDGLYRSAHNFRHRPRDAFTQIANELAGRGLCHPLIPSVHADIKAYLRAFTHRLTQAVTVLVAADPTAVLCVIIDAADNAEMAALADGEASSFARHLMHAPMPAGVRLVFTSRSHRRDKLQAPIDAVQILLAPFTPTETGRHLRREYPDASDAEVGEFAYLSNHNPRVQALAMDAKAPLRQMLQNLGPNPTTIERAIGDLLGSAIARLKASSHSIDANQIDDICRGLAVLRPLVPIDVLARLTGVDAGAIRTFAYDLGRPLSVRGGSLHFLDEPAETWFRETYAPDAASLSVFLDRLRPLAVENAYVAGVVPHLMLEAGRRQELVDLALSADDLPTANPLERRDIELRRLIFALKACLRHKTYADAAKLALKAAGETAGEDRQEDLLQSNIHLAGALLEPDRVLDLVSRRTFGSDWMGSHHAYDAAILSGREDLAAEGRSRLRMATEWFMAWARKERQEDDWSREETVSDEDRAAIALAELRLRGAKRATKFLRGWRDRSLSFTAGRLLADQLVDLGEYQRLDELAVAARNDVWLLLALSRAARAAGRSLPTPVLARLMRLLSFERLKLGEFSGWDNRWDMLGAVSDAVELAIVDLPPDNERWAKLLRRYLPETPPTDLTSRYGVNRPAILRPYVLEATLRDVDLQLVDVAPASIRKEIEDKGRSYGRSGDADIFTQEASGLLPWLKLLASVRCGRSPADLPAAIAEALKLSEAAIRQGYRETHGLRNAIASIWANLLADARATDPVYIDPFIAWKSKGGEYLQLDTLTGICRRMSRTPGLENLAIDFAAEAGAILEGSREQAETRTEAFMKLARAVYVASRAEAGAYFDRGVTIADRVGEENVERWTALLHLAHAAAEPGHPRSKTAYRLSRAAALVYEYVARDKYFDWDTTVAALAKLCPNSVLAILSRWRDRQFGDKGRVLEEAIGRLVADGQLPPLAPIVLSGMEIAWNRPKILQGFLASGEQSWRRRSGAELAYRYMRTFPYDAERWTELAKTASEEGFDFPDVERLVAFRTAASRAAPEKADTYQPRERRTPDWSTFFNGVDLTDSNALLAAYKRLRTYDAPYELDEFYKQTVARLSPGAESAWIRALGEWPDLDFYDLERVLQFVSSAWWKRPAFRSAAKDVALALCRREPGKIYFSGFNRSRRFATLFEEGVLTRADAMEACLAGYAEQVEIFGSSGLFQLVEPLSLQLAPAEADEALEFGLDLLEPTLTVEDGDGEWRTELAPAGGVIEALAGYVWAGLASPIAAERWEFAHVVRAAIELDWSEFSAALASLATQGEGRAFVDQGLQFYAWHARQWLAIGLARGGRDKPEGLAPFVPWLTAQLSTHHVIVRAFAADALTSWAKTPEGRLGTSTDLEAVNRSPFPTQTYKGWRELDVDDRGDDADEEADGDDRYYFGIDIGPYWLKPMGRIFGVSERGAERRALNAIRDIMSWKTRGGWREDARHSRSVFRDEETSHSHGSFPKVDDLTAYHGYHAMMFSAGQLLQERPVGHDEHASKDDFEDWLADHLLTRPDGRWLSDRVDPALIEGVDPQTNRDTWPWEVNTAHLDRQLRTHEGDLVLWGHWSNGHDDKRETIDVQSALVSEPAALALLAALQTAPDPGRFRLPDAEPDEAVEIAAAKLTGWVDDIGLPRRLDEFDPWLGDLRYPAAVPNAIVRDALALTGDADGRNWRGECGERLRSESWSTVQGYGREQESVAHWRLSGNGPFAAALLEANPGTVMILRVAIRRPLPSYEVKKGGFEPYPWPYVRYYLMRFDGVAIPH